MPLLTESFRIEGAAGTFTFSAVRPDQLENTSYSLVTIVLDKSGSVASYRDDLLKAIKAIADACKKDPMAESLIIRVIEFDDSVHEIHAFKPQGDININDYDKYLQCGGMTSLYDAVFNAIGATNTYATSLSGLDMEVNGVVFIVTDGEDNMSKKTPNSIKQEVEKAIKGEHIASLTTILVGVNTGGISSYLQQFQIDAKLDQYVDMGDATPQKLAKLAAWVSKSISSVSSSLQQGSAPAVSSLTF
jgi:uncharacterized protein YegL